MVGYKELHCHHCFSTLVENMPHTKVKASEECGNYMVHISLWFILIVLTYWVGDIHNIKKTHKLIRH